MMTTNRVFAAHDAGAAQHVALRLYVSARRLKAAMLRSLIRLVGRTGGARGARGVSQCPKLI
jgi:hypothetical protein